jgi:DNA-binding response OmpR family regulator
MPRILVIDDNKDLLKIVKILLCKRGFDVLTHLDWEVANKSIRLFKPHLILLDVFLSGIDGLDVCQRIKASPYSRHIPVLLFSAFPHIAETGIRDYGADDFIAKPFDVGDLIKKIYSILSRKG